MSVRQDSTTVILRQNALTRGADMSVIVKNGIEATGGLMCGLMDEYATVLLLFSVIVENLYRL